MMFVTSTVQPHQIETFDVIKRAGVYHWRRERPGRSTVSTERFQTPYDAATAAANLAHANGAHLGPNARRMVGRYFVPAGNVQEVA